MKENQAPFRRREVVEISEDGTPIFADNSEEATKRALNSERVASGLEKSYPGIFNEARRRESPRGRRTKHSKRAR